MVVDSFSNFSVNKIFDLILIVVPEHKHLLVISSLVIELDVLLLELKKRSPDLVDVMEH